MIPSYASANINSAAFRLDQQRPTAEPRLRDQFNELNTLVELRDQLRDLGYDVAARTLKEEIVGLLERHLDGDLDREALRGELARLAAQSERGVREASAYRAEQMAAARAHAQATALDIDPAIGF